MKTMKTMVAVILTLVFVSAGGSNNGGLYAAPSTDYPLTIALYSGPTQGDTSSADYKRDVEQAADLQFQHGEAARRYLNKEIDAAMYQESNIRAAGLTRLNAKWRAAGRGSEFQRDYMRRVSVLAATQRSRPSKPQPWRSPSGNLLRYTVVALLLLALGLARETRTFGLDGSDPFTIRSGWTSYKVYSSTGTVLSPTKSRVVTTHVSGGGAGNQPISTSTSTSIHDQFFIRESNGNERDFQLTNMNLALREGHLVSAVWCIKKGKKSGSYVLFRNHSTRHADFVDSTVNAMLRPDIWPVLPLIFTALVVVAGWVHMCMWCLFAIFGEHITARSFFGLLAALVAVPVGFSIVAAIARNQRVQRFKRQIADRLLPILDKRATEQMAWLSGPTATPG